MYSLRTNVPLGRGGPDPTSTRKATLRPQVKHHIGLLLHKSPLHLSLPHSFSLGENLTIKKLAVPAEVKRRVGRGCGEVLLIIYRPRTTRALLPLETKKMEKCSWGLRQPRPPAGEEEHNNEHTGSPQTQRCWRSLHVREGQTPMRGPRDNAPQRKVASFLLAELLPCFNFKPRRCERDLIRCCDPPAGR